MTFRKNTIVLLCLCFIAQLCHLAGAQTTNNPLQEQIDEAEARAKIAKSKKDEIDARFPKPDRGDLVGGTSVKGDFIETKMLGYCAMKSAASSIASDIKKRMIGPGLPAPRFVIYSEADVKMLMRYQLMTERLIMLNAGYRALPGFAVGGAAARGFGPGLIADTALDYLSLLKTDIEINGTEFDITEKELVAEVFNNLQGLELYYPSRVPLSLRNTAASSPLFANIKNVSEAYIGAKELALSPTDADRRDKLDILYNNTMRELGLGKAPPPAPAAVPPAPCLPPAACPNNYVQTNVNVNTGDAKNEDGGGSSTDKTFFSYLQADNLFTEINLPHTYWIDLQVVKAGGNMRIKSNFITNFMIGSRVNFSGGAIVYFQLFDSQGRSKISGVRPFYEKYRKSDQINGTCG